MSLCLVSFGISSLLDRHAITARILLLVAIFVVGYAEAAILKSRGVASVTWLIALAAACVWIAYPATPIRVAAGLGAFVLGVIALIIFYRGRPRGVSP